MTPIEPDLTTTPVLELNFPELKEGTCKFEDEIQLQRWLVAELNNRWYMRPRSSIPMVARYQDISINDFIAMVFRHYYDQGTNFTLQGKSLRGFMAVYDASIQSFQLNPIIEQGPMTVEVREITDDSAQ